MTKKEKKRILLKISGEAFKGENDFGIDPNAVKNVCKIIKDIKKTGCELAIVVGGGNIYRGSMLIKEGLTSSDSHNISMLATVFNGVVLKDFLNKSGIDAVVMNELSIEFLENFNKEKAKDYLKGGKVVIFVTGTGNPYFTTDTGGVLKSLEIEVDFMIKATKVDGVYSDDPVKNPKAKFYDKVSYDFMLKNDIKIMDLTSIVMAKENNLVIKIVNFNKKDSIIKSINGEKEGSIIS